MLFFVGTQISYVFTFLRVYTYIYYMYMRGCALSIQVSYCYSLHSPLERLIYIGYICV